jgi:ubiquinone/menaquinone biosynthesis C-methylase UbiE
MIEQEPPVCSYEGSDYQVSFWDQGDRSYEDQVEAVAIKRLLPAAGGDLLLEVGAGAGRNTLRYKNYKRIVLLDYALTQLQQAQQRLGRDKRFIYVQADVYKLPFVPGLFDAATMIRTFHHLADPVRALEQVRQVMHAEAIFLLEFPNKKNLKSILRYAIKKQTWSPFTPGAVEFAPLNFNFHPQTVRKWLTQCGFTIERQLTVSHFRINWMKKHIPISWLIKLDSLAQWTGNWWQLSPSVFLRARLPAQEFGEESNNFFRCPTCEHYPLQESASSWRCTYCGRTWPIRDGIHIFRDE